MSDFLYVVPRYYWNTYLHTFRHISCRCVFPNLSMVEIFWIYVIMMQWRITESSYYCTRFGLPLSANSKLIAFVTTFHNVPTPKPHEQMCQTQWFPLCNIYTVLHFHYWDAATSWLATCRLTLYMKSYIYIYINIYILNILVKFQLSIEPKFPDHRDGLSSSSFKLDPR